MLTKNLKRAEAASAVRYSGWPPGALGATRSSSARQAHAVSMCWASHGFPTSRSHVLGLSTTVGASPPHAKHASLTTQLPPSAASRTRMPAVTIEMSSSRRRACLKGVANSSGRVWGTRIETITSDGCSATLR